MRPLLTVLVFLLVPQLAAAEPCPETIACPDGAQLETQGEVRTCVRDGSPHGPKVTCAGELVRSSEHYRDGARSGLQRYYGSTGLPHYEEPYHDGKVHGRYRRWYPSGTLRSEIWMKQGKRHGLEREWHPNGAIYYKGRTRNDLHVGLWETWSDNGHVQSVMRYDEDGRLHGVVRRFHSDGTPSEIANYKRGALDGDYVSFDLNGSPLMKGQYVAGLRSGVWTEAYSGNVETGPVENDKRHGAWTRSAPGSEVVEHLTYDDGTLNGPYRRETAGEVTESGRYERGFKDGIWKKLTAVGELELRETFDFGMQLESCEPKARGKLDCRSTVPWRSLNLDACTVKGPPMADAINDAATFAAQFSCPKSFDAIDWSHYRIWIRQVEAVEGSVTLADVERVANSFRAVFTTRHLCSGIELPARLQTFAILMPRSEKPIIIEDRRLKVEPCGLVP